MAERQSLATPLLGRGRPSSGPRLPVRKSAHICWGHAVAGLEHVGQSLELDPVIDWQPVAGRENWSDVAVSSAPRDEACSIV